MDTIGDWTPFELRRFIQGQIANDPEGMLPEIASNSVFVVSYDPPRADQIWLLPVDNTNGITWAFRFNSQSALLFKWEFIGGGPLQHEIATNELTAAGPTAYVDLATVGPTVTVPRTGSYDITFGCQTFYTAGGPGNADTYMSPKLGAAATIDADGITHNNQVAGQMYDHPARSIRRSLTAADIVKCQYKINGPANGNFNSRWMEVRPVCVY